METLDCGIFYEWEYDNDFISILSENFKIKKISHEIFDPGNFEDVLEKLRRKTLSFGAVVDRASDVDENCEAIVGLLHRRGITMVNDPPKVRHSSDKASMHLEFMTAGIYVPYTIIISPYNTQREIRLSIDELARLGGPFIIKPANTTGGGIGVVTGAEGLREVIDTRQHNKDDKYLLQQKIEPAILDDHRAWFRPFYVFGRIFICWWDDLTHIYLEASPGDINRHNLRKIEDVVKRIYGVCELDFFSTEIAITSEKKLVVIDYVNEMCDMRLKSQHYDGVPDSTVEQIARQIASGIRGLIGA
ncbi:MAG: hypothetical protein ACLP05_06800 [Candidatus Kryptoniota bacterium]